ncbi:hypothetical protein CMK11_02075 [Candidatus Poribacteria bacterium]|nr:hypothetical protein [Candidatus Poribacteria bacterium]
MVMDPAATGPSLPSAPHLALGAPWGVLAGRPVAAAGVRFRGVPRRASTGPASRPDEGSEAPSHFLDSAGGHAELRLAATATRLADIDEPPLDAPAQPKSDGGLPVWLIGSGLAVVGGIVAFLLLGDDAEIAAPIVEPEWPLSGPPGRPSR